MLHGRLPFQEAEDERRGSAAVLCGGQPRRHHRVRRVAARADGDTAAEERRAVMEALTDCSRIDGETEEVSNEMEVVAGMIQRLVDENAIWKLDQENYRRKYAGYTDRYAALESRMDGLKKERERREIQHDLFSGFLSGLEKVRELPVDFSGKLFHRLVDYATVYSDGRVVFTFRNGAEISTKI